MDVKGEKELLARSETLVSIAYVIDEGIPAFIIHTLTHNAHTHTQSDDLRLVVQEILVSQNDLEQAKTLL